MVRVGAYAPIGKDWRKNKEKKLQISENGGVLVSMHTMISSRKMVSMGMVLGGGHFEEFRDSNGCIVCNLRVYANGMKKYK